MVKIYEWFGYKFHLLVDVKHEVVLAGTSLRRPARARATASVLPRCWSRPNGYCPQGRIETLAYDKAADDEKTHELLDQHGIKPVIQNRAMWKDEPERPLPRARWQQQCVHDEAGTVYCYDTVERSAGASTRWLHRAMRRIGGR